MSERPLYVAIGDSLTVGIGSTFFQPNFVKLYHHALENHYQLPFKRRVFAKNGATTEAISQWFGRPEVAEAIREARVITLTGGGNDLLHAEKLWMRSGTIVPVIRAINLSLSHFNSMIHQIVRLHAGGSAPYMVRVLNLYNPFFYLPDTRRWLDRYNEQLNNLEYAPFICVADIHHAFFGREPALLSFDRVHPNPLGYRIMAETVTATGFAPIA